MLTFLLAARRESRSELVEPEVVLIDLRPLRDGLQAIEEIQLRIASDGGSNGSLAISILGHHRNATFDCVEFGLLPLTACSSFLGVLPDR